MNVVRWWNDQSNRTIISALSRDMAGALCWCDVNYLYSFNTFNYVISKLKHSAENFHGMLKTLSYMNFALRGARSKKNPRYMNQMYQSVSMLVVVAYLRISKKKLALFHSGFQLLLLFPSRSVISFRCMQLYYGYYYISCDFVSIHKNLHNLKVVQNGMEPFCTRQGKWNDLSINIKRCYQTT